jgi:hypothetical protein
MQDSLQAYLEGLSSKTDEYGAPLFELPSTYMPQVEALMMERRADFKSLQGWEGLHK